jgi:2-iminobutanoate/2-iminopropanoate deaminase
MPKRQSVNFPGFAHSNPIPNASRIGNLMMSSVISGADPGTRTYPPTLAGQVANIFTHIRAAIEAAGGSPDNIIKITFYVQDQAAGRAALNEEWEKMFPDPDSRPARHTLNSGGSGPSLVTCDFVAVLS